MTANSARKSPNRLTTCATHTCRMTSIRSTSRNVSGAGGAAGLRVAVMVTLVGVLLCHGYEQVAIRRLEQTPDRGPVGLRGVGVAQRAGLGAQECGARDAVGRRLVQQRVLVGHQPADLFRAVLAGNTPRHPPRELGAGDGARIVVRP